MGFRILHELIPTIEKLPAEEQCSVWIAIAELMMRIIKIPQPSDKTGLSCVSVGDNVLRIREYRGRRIIDIVQYGEESKLQDPPLNYVLLQYDNITGEFLKEHLRPFGVWQAPIDDEQLKLAEIDAEGPVSVTGNAGTGKSTVAIHRVRWLLQNGFPNKGRVLLVSFSSTLVHELRRLLLGLYIHDKISWDEYCRVDVKTLDRIAIDVCNGLGKNIVYELDEYRLLIDWMNQAYREYNVIIPDAPSNQFMLSYFEDAVLDYRLDSKYDYEDYINKDQNGAGQSSQRRRVWPVFELMLNYEKKSQDVLRSYGFRLAENEYERNPSQYCSIVVDEAQDLGVPELRMLAKMTDNSMAYPKRNSLFFIGDGFQRIFGREAVLRECGINVGRRGGGRYRHMKKNYRSTRQIREFAFPFIKNVLARNLDGEALSARDGLSVSEGETPMIEFFDGYPQMNQQIAKVIKGWQSHDAGGTNQLENYAVLMRDTAAHGIAQKALYGQVKGLKGAGLNAEPVDWNIPPRDDNAVKVMSMHRAKGLQFDGVVVVIDHWPYQVDQPLDFTESELRRKFDSELCLMYTAMMRSQRHLFITGTSVEAQRKFLEYMSNDVALGKVGGGETVENGNNITFQLS